MEIIGKIPNGYIVNVTSKKIANIAGCAHECNVAYEVHSPYKEVKFNELNIGDKICVSERFIDSRTVLSAYKELKSKLKSVTTQLNTLSEMMEKSNDININN